MLVRSERVLGKYASATALAAQTKAAIKIIESIMSKETVINGQTAFRAADKGDETALKVVEKYIRCRGW